MLCVILATRAWIRTGGQDKAFECAKGIHLPLVGSSLSPAIAAMVDAVTSLQRGPRGSAHFRDAIGRVTEWTVSSLLNGLSADKNGAHTNPQSTCQQELNTVRYCELFDRVLWSKSLLYIDTYLSSVPDQRHFRPLLFVEALVQMGNCCICWLLGVCKCCASTHSVQAV